MRLPPSSAVLDHTSAFPLTSPPLSQTPREAGRTSHLVSRPKPPSQRPHCCLSQSEYVTGLGTLSPEAGLGKTQLPGPLGTTAGPRPSPGLPARAVGRACDRVLPAPCLGSWRGLVMPLRVSSHFGRISLDPLGPPFPAAVGGEDGRALVAPGVCGAWRFQKPPRNGGLWRRSVRRAQLEGAAYSSPFYCCRFSRFPPSSPLGRGRGEGPAILASGPSRASPCSFPFH